MADEPTDRGWGRGLASLIGDMGDGDRRPNAEALANATSAGCRSSCCGRTRIILARHSPTPNSTSSRHRSRNAASSSRSRCVPVSARDDSYEIIAGERRWRAAQRADLHEVPVVVHEVTDEEALEPAIIENVQRADLNPLEEAPGYQALADDHQLCAG